MECIQYANCVEVIAGCDLSSATNTSEFRMPQKREQGTLNYHHLTDRFHQIEIGGSVQWGITRISPVVKLAMDYAEVLLNRPVFYQLVLSCLLSFVLLGNSLQSNGFTLMGLLQI